MNNNKKIVIRNGFLWDAHREKERKDILIIDNTIKAILPVINDPDAFVVDVKGDNVSPGFINSHTHIFFEDAHDKERFAAMAEQGIHAVHDLGFLIDTPLHECMKIKKEYNVPRFPAIHESGKYICVKGGYGECTIRSSCPTGYVVSSTESIRECVDYILSEGCDLIKIGMDWGRNPYQEAPNLPIDYIDVISKCCKEHRARLSAHVTELRYLEILVDHGINEMAHIVGEDIPDYLITKIVDKKINCIPTLSIFQRKIQRMGEKMRPKLEAAMRNTYKLYNAGVKISIGNDFMMFNDKHEFPIDELRLMKDAGIDTKGIMNALTINGAECCGWADRMGTLDVGKLACIVAFPGSIDRTFEALERIRLSINKGVILKNDYQH